MGRLVRPAGLAVVLILVGLSAAWWFNGRPGPGTSGETSEGSQKARAAYAFVTAEAMVVVSDGRQVARHTGKFSTPGAEMPRWTLDGRYLFFLAERTSGSGVELAGQQLVAVEAATGRTRQIPCPGCASAGPAGGSRVLAYQRGGGHVLRLDLASADPPVFFEVSFPGQGGTVRILTGLPGKAVLAASDPAQVSAYGGPENLFVLGTDAAVRDAGSSGSDSPVPLAAASTHSSYPGADVALIGGVHGGACETAQSVMLMDSRTGKTVTTDLSAAQAPGGEPGSTGGLGVHDLWWDRKGRLFAAVEAWTCDHSRQNPRVVAAPPGLWRLEGRRWTKAEDNTMAKVRELRDGTRLVLTSGALGASGTLHEQQPKEEPRVVSSDVLDILAPPL